MTISNRIPWKDRKFAIGISSFRPAKVEFRETFGAFHNLLFDIDSQDCFKDFLDFLDKKYGALYFVWLSKRGIHGVHLFPYTFEEMIREAENCPYVDQQWVKIGRQRGHLFLAEDQPIAIGCVTYMELWRDFGKEKSTQHSGLGR